MNYDEAMHMDAVEFGNMPPRAFMLGLLSAFENRFHACADRFFRQITWKQFFAIICVNLCKESPTINDLARVMGSSHQNVKQILLKLEKKGFIRMIPDEKDKRKQRIALTKECLAFCEKNDRQSREMIEKMYQGIPEEQLLITTQTLIQMERNIEAL